MDEKLAAYRKEKAKKQLKEKIHKRIELFFSSILKFKSPFRSMSINEVPSSENNCMPLNGINETETKYTYMKFVISFLVWLLFYIYFIYIEFGAVYFCITALLFIYYNTRTDKKIHHEVSAYSVFNKNCQAIDGTFTAEQFEKNLRSGMI